ncbi:MAG: formate dehydrogenase subunit gamma [Armatimonadota bacterium]
MTIGAKSDKRADKREFLRFTLLFRLQHMALFLSVFVLIITGLPMRYADTSWAGWYFRAVGGIQTSAFIHRIGATLLISVGVFHMLYITLTKEGRREFRQLLPRVKDVTDVVGNVLYFLGISKERPRFGRFSYIEKFDYWAVYWGMVVMIVSGLMLWFHGQIMNFVPKLYLDVAREAHSDEALLATLAIVIWHFYNVHFNPRRFPGSLTWLTGKISEEEMMHDHPLEYEEVLSRTSNGLSEANPTSCVCTAKEEE